MANFGLGDFRYDTDGDRFGNPCDICPSADHEIDAHGDVIPDAWE